MLDPKEIQDIASTIEKQVNPKQIYLFGSYASGEAREGSDLDLLVVDDSSQNKKALALKISKSLFPRNYGLDLIVASPGEIREKQKKQLTFWVNIVKNGKILYERN